jgi:hypothetical protein
MRGNGSEFLPNYVEHLVPLEEKKLILPKKLAIIFSALVLVIVAILFVALYVPAFAGPMSVIFIGIAILVWYLWRFVSVEFEYTILQGEINIDVVYGRRQRKEFYSTPVSHVEKFAPLGGDTAFPPNPGEYKKICFAASSKKNPNTWYAVIREADQSRTLLFFEMTPKAEKVLRFYNGRAFLGA